MPVCKRVREGVMLAEALVGLSVAFLLLLGLCTMLQQWRAGVAGLEARGLLVDVASRVIRAAGREDHEELAACARDAARADAWLMRMAGDEAAGTTSTVRVSMTADPDVLRVRVEVRAAADSATASRGAVVALERLVARPEASLRMAVMR